MPIIKPGKDPTSPGSYRPIALTSHISIPEQHQKGKRYNGPSGLFGNRYQKSTGKQGSWVGTTGRAFSWIKNFLEEKNIQIQMGTAFSARHTVENGVCQGSVTSPLFISSDGK